MSDSWRPIPCEIWELCPDCGEQLDWAREECVTLSCPRYLEVTNSLDAECASLPALAALESAPFEDEEISDEEEAKAAEARAYVDRRFAVRPRVVGLKRVEGR